LWYLLTHTTLQRSPSRKVADQKTPFLSSATQDDRVVPVRGLLPWRQTNEHPQPHQHQRHSNDSRDRNLSTAMRSRLPRLNTCCDNSMMLFLACRPSPLHAVERGKRGGHNRHSGDSPRSDGALQGNSPPADRLLVYHYIKLSVTCLPHRTSQLALRYTGAVPPTEQRLPAVGAEGGNWGATVHT